MQNQRTIAMDDAEVARMFGNFKVYYFVSIAAFVCGFAMMGVLAFLGDNTADEYDRIFQVSAALLSLFLLALFVIISVSVGWYASKFSGRRVSWWNAVLPLLGIMTPIWPVFIYLGYRAVRTNAMAASKR